MIIDRQYDMEVHKCFNELVLFVVDIPQGNNNINMLDTKSKSSSSSKRSSRKYKSNINQKIPFQDDSSTIKTTESNKKPIPETVSISTSNNSAQNKNVTGRRYRNSASSFPSFEDELKLATKSNKPTS